MKVPPGSVPAPLTLNPTPAGVHGHHYGHHSSSAASPFAAAESLFWRYPMLLPHHAAAAAAHAHGQPPHTPTTPTTPLLLDLRSQMPQNLATDPRSWTRDDVTKFLKWFQEEFDLPAIEFDKFCMNGKALSLLTKQDVCQRAPGAGDILHNALQLLLAASATMRFHQQPPTPISSMAPTSVTSLSVGHNAGSPPPPSPVSHAATNHQNGGHYYSNGGRRSPPTSSATSITSVADQLGSHFLAPPSSVTLSPAPSTDDGNSTSGSPKHVGAGSAADFHHQASLPLLAAAAAARSHQQHQQAAALFYASGGGAAHALDSSNGLADHANSSESNGANSDIDDNDVGSDGGQRDHGSPHSSGSSDGNGHMTNHQATAHLHHHHHHHHHMSKLHSAFGYPAAPSSPGPIRRNGRASSPGSPDGYDGSPGNGGPIKEEVVETGSGGRLLWDFLQQLLNDPTQKYSHLIAWKNHDTGVFKIMDPAGLARLWGIQKNHLSMNYDKMSRALRYYYRVNILKKVQGERHCYQFLRNPSELKGIKNISLLRHLPPPASYSGNEDQQQPTKMTNGNASPPPRVVTVPVAGMDDGPHDLSIPKSADRDRDRDSGMPDSPVFTFNHCNGGPTSSSSSSGYIKSEPDSDEPASPVGPYSPTPSTVATKRSHLASSSSHSSSRHRLHSYDDSPPSPTADVMDCSPAMAIVEHIKQEQD